MHYNPSYADNLYADILGKKHKHLAVPHDRNDTEYWNEWRRAMDERLSELGY